PPVGRSPVTVSAATGEASGAALAAAGPPLLPAGGASDFVHPDIVRASRTTTGTRICRRMVERATMRGSLHKRGASAALGVRIAAMERTLVELLASKRDGHVLAESEIRRLITSFTDGQLADYQMAAFLMAVFFRGLDDAETVALTEAMLHSGSVLDLKGVAGIKVDKHSTGGVGDKVSICLAPLVAACGVPVPMVSGRGLGHTGGTLDKLEAIPGFRTDLSTQDFARIVGEIGTCMIGQTKDIAPADKRIYALRDVTATVESIPLIVASILSKKLAEGIDGLVLDVKVGRGAFMKDEARATDLADKLVRVGTRAGKKVVAVLTRMDTPLGRTVGNANETREALEVLHGKGPADLVECTLVLGAEMLVLGGVASDVADGRRKLEEAIAKGTAVRTMERMVEAQGGDPKVVARPELLDVAGHVLEVRASRAGFVSELDALAIGLTGVAMGAGRTRADQKVDPAVGIELDAKPGDPVQVGQVVARLFVRDAKAADAGLVERVAGAFRYEDVAPAATPLVVKRITA
ncbi:MAG: Pyrimidine-nucleoside phosphorylase, partial [Labilithrix sp.]|nr:Pyrimidine-nucleoside phosphorylase [Labilithrix sp.]